jgi:polyribonucleotide nucleotidyltransferase
VDDITGLRSKPEQRLDLVVAGTKDAVMMVESEAYELSEAEMLGAVTFAHEQMQPVIDLIVDLAEDAAKEPFDFQPVDYSALSARVRELGEARMREAFAIREKQDRTAAVASRRGRDQGRAFGRGARGPDAVAGAQGARVERAARRHRARAGGGSTGAASTWCGPSCRRRGCCPGPTARRCSRAARRRRWSSPRSGTGDDEQFIDALHGNFKENFLLHYNFPPYSVGRGGPRGLARAGARSATASSPGGRSRRCCRPRPDFPYTIRVVSEITESNGSSSMASVCGGSLSMMDAGVPLKAPVAGVAMGLVLEEDGQWAVLTDILGDEDHLGDMDFKVAGTEAGITSLQMDIKVAGITPAIMEKALEQARVGRLHILGEMAKALSSANSFSVHAPRIETMTIPTDKIREVIGSGGKVIREIVEVSGAKVDINDDGTIKIASSNGDAIKKAYDMIYAIVAEPEEGGIYRGTVVKVVDFGAFVNFFGKRDGLVHVSQIENRRLGHPSEALKEGQEVWVKLLGFDDRGKVRLSMKVVDQATGKELAKEEQAAE